MLQRLGLRTCSLNNLSYTCKMQRLRDLFVDGVMSLHLARVYKMQLPVSASILMQRCYTSRVRIGCNLNGLYGSFTSIGYISRVCMRCNCHLYRDHFHCFGFVTPLSCV